MNKTKKNDILKNILKWGLIFGLLIFGCLKNKSFMLEAWEEVWETAAWQVALVFVIANLYYLAEGKIISAMTSTGKRKLTFAQGVYCSYMCAFYKLATLGSATGIAQLLYYNAKGIEVSRATGMSIAQYTFQKIAIGILGVVSFFILLAMGESELLDYIFYMLAGVALITFVCAFLFIITVSKKISDWLMFLVRKLVKEKSRLYPRVVQLENSINQLQDQGRKIWHNKKLFFTVSFFNLLKFLCWYSIPAIIFADEYGLSAILCIALMAVCNMLGCVMLAPSGVGTLDFVFATFFAALIPEADAIAAALVLYRFFTWVVPFVIGLIPAILLKRETREENA